MPKLNSNDSLLPMRPKIDPTIVQRIDLNIQIEPVIYVRLFLDVLAEEGIFAGKVLTGTGLSPIDLADPKNLITITQQIQIYENIAKLSKNPTIGLSHGKRIMPHHHGVWGYAMQTAANLGQAIRIFNRYFDVAGPVARQVLHVDDDVTRWVSCDVLPKEPARRVAIEEMLSGNFTLCQQLTEGHFKLQELRLDYAPPKGHKAYEELFQCPVLFNQDSIEMRFDREFLKLQMKYSDPDTVRVCEESCRQLLDHVRGPGNVVDKVRQIIYESSCDRRDVDAVASKLCMSARTLRRHLAKENISFRSLLNEVQQAVAIDYLCSTDLSIDEIAFLLGYSETSNFRHAFKQWLGQSPTQYRKERR